LEKCKNKKTHHDLKAKKSAFKKYVRLIEEQFYRHGGISHQNAVRFGETIKSILIKFDETFID